MPQWAGLAGGTHGAESVRKLEERWYVFKILLQKTLAFNM